MNSQLSIDQLVAVQLKGDRFLRLLGEGSCGVVVKCRHTLLDVVSVLKVNDRKTIGKREVKGLRSVQGHPNIVTFYGAWTFKNIHVIRME